MSQNMQGGEDVSPLDHFSQRTPLQHFGAENISRLLCQEAYMDQDLREDRDTLWQRVEIKVCGEAAQQSRSL